MLGGSPRAGCFPEPILSLKAGDNTALLGKGVRGRQREKPKTQLREKRKWEFTGQPGWSKRMKEKATRPRIREREKEEKKRDAGSRKTEIAQQDGKKEERIRKRRRGCMIAEDGSKGGRSGDGGVYRGRSL